MKILCLLSITALMLSACRTLDYAHDRGISILDREARQTGQRLGD